MKYVIVCVLKGDVEKYHQNLVSEICSNFDTCFLASQNAPTHFTLKDVFEADNIKELEELLESFSRIKKPTKLTVEGFNKFKDNVVFMNVCPTDEAYNVYMDFINELKKLKWMQWSEYDGVNRSFHLTLACFDISSKYEDIIKHLKDYDCYFEILFDNITIYQDTNNDGKWQLHKSYVII